jgi:hypothetical protein
VVVKVDVEALGDVVVAHPDESVIGCVVGHVRVADGVLHCRRVVCGRPSGGDYVAAVDAGVGSQCTLDGLSARHGALCRVVNDWGSESQL